MLDEFCILFHPTSSFPKWGCCWEIGSSQVSNRQKIEEKTRSVRTTYGPVAIMSWPKSPNLNGWLVCCCCCPCGTSGFYNFSSKQFGLERRLNLCIYCACIRCKKALLRQIVHPNYYPSPTRYVCICWRFFGDVFATNFPSVANKIWEIKRTCSTFR